MVCYFGIYNKIISCIRCGELVQKVCQNGIGSDYDCQNTNYRAHCTARSSTLARIKHFICETS